MARPRKVQRTSTNSRKKENTPTAKTEHNTPSTSSLLSPKGLLDLPAELRNTVYRYVLTSSEPTKLECERIPGRTARYRFTMIPALTLVSKQLRLETRRIFLGSNVFSLTPELFKRQSERPLRAISRMHKDVGLDLKTLQITLEVKKRCDEELYSMTAALTLHVVEDQITVTEQAYRASHIGRRESNWPASYIPHVKVCGCRGQTFAEAFNARPSRSHDLIACVQLLKRSLCRGTVSYLAEDMRRTDEVVLHARYCAQCSESGAGEDYFLF